MEGKNTADHATLIQLGTAIGMESGEVAQALAGDTFAEAVQYDIYQARQVGVTGVPFFVFQNKYAVSGARGSVVFLQMLNQVAGE